MKFLFLLAQLVKAPENRDFRLPSRAGRRIGMIVSVEIGNRVATIGMFRDRSLADDGFSVTAGNIQNIGWLAQA